MKPRYKKLLTYSAWAVMCIGLLVLLSFVGHEQEQLRCKSLEVTLLPDDGTLFITRDKVVREVTNGGEEATLMGKPVVDFNVGQLEEQLEMNPFVKSAEVFIDIQGNLQVEVIQRRPIIRIMRGDGSGFYIDEEGIKVPLSNTYTAHVPIATGNIYEKLKTDSDSLYSKVGKDLYAVAAYLDKNPFWKAMVDQIEVNEKSEMVFVPKIADHLVVLGDASRLDEKFTRLKIFYKKGLNKVGWDKYKVINIKYTGQIVCEKY